MAILKRGPIGEVTGRLDNLVVRKVNGKQVVSVRPRTYKKTKSEKAKSIRSRFSVAVEFSRCINSIPQLKEIWKAANENCFSAFNRIEKENIPLVDARAPSLRNVITPAAFSLSHGCEFPFTEFDFSADGITGKWDPHFDDTRYQNNKNYFLVVVFSFFDPKDKGGKYFAPDSIVYSDPFASTGQAGEQHLLPVTPEIQEKTSRYNNVILYAAMVITGGTTGEVYCSLTRSEGVSLP